MHWQLRIDDIADTRNVTAGAQAERQQEQQGSQSHQRQSDALARLLDDDAEAWVGRRGLTLHGGQDRLYVEGDMLRRAALFQEGNWAPVRSI